MSAGHPTERKVDKTYSLNALTTLQESFSIVHCGVHPDHAAKHSGGAT
jgi:hypothetical protein